MGVGLDGSKNDNSLFCAGKLILLALLDDADVSQQNLRYDLRPVRRTSCLSDLLMVSFLSHVQVQKPFVEGFAGLQRCLQQVRKFNLKALNVKIHRMSVRASSFGLVFHSHRNIHFGFMEGNEYINGLIMG